MMLDFHEKRKLKGILYGKWTIAAIFLFAIFLSTAVHERYTRMREMAEKTDALSAELDELKLRASALESEVDRLKSDRGVEEELRDRYEVSRPGEEVVVMVGDKDDEKGATETPQEPAPQTESFFKRLWP